MRNTVIAMLVAVSYAVRVSDQHPCHFTVDPESEQAKGFVHTPLEDVTLPDAWDWGNADGVNYLT